MSASTRSGKAAERTTGGFNIMRYGAGTSGPARTLGQYMLGSAATFGYVLDHRRSKSGKNWLRVGVQVFHVDRNGDTDGGEVACG